MAFHVRGQTYPCLVAAGDYTNSQHRFVFVNTDGKAQLSAAGGPVDGVMENDPRIDCVATVHAHGVGKVEASGAIALGDKVSSDVDGMAKTAAAGEQVVGVCVVGAGAPGEIASVMFGSQEGAVA